MFEFEITGLEFADQLTRDKFTSVFNKHMSHMLRGFASYAKGKVRNFIKNDSRSLAHLSTITWMNKVGSKPLYDTGDFAKSVSSQMIRRLREGVIGIDIKPKKGIHTPSELSYEKIWEIMIQGATYTPTKKQRKWMKINLEQSGLSNPSATRKPTWTIPGRPFLEKSLDTIEVRDRFHDMCNEAFDRTMKELGWRLT